MIRIRGLRPIMDASGAHPGGTLVDAWGSILVEMAPGLCRIWRGDQTFFVWMPWQYWGLTIAYQSDGQVFPRWFVTGVRSTRATDTTASVWPSPLPNVHEIWRPCYPGRMARRGIEQNPAAIVGDAWSQFFDADYNADTVNSQAGTGVWQKFDDPSLGAYTRIRHVLDQWERFPAPDQLPFESYVVSDQHRSVGAMMDLGKGGALQWVDLGLDELNASFLATH